jgi:hypothetical protein
MKERDVSFGAILIFSKPGLFAAAPGVSPRQIHWTLRLASCLSLVRFGANDPAFCSVRRFAFSRRIPDLGLCLARRSGHRGIHCRAERPNA